MHPVKNQAGLQDPTRFRLEKLAFISLMTFYYFFLYREIMQQAAVHLHSTKKFTEHISQNQKSMQLTRDPVRTI